MEHEQKLKGNIEKKKEQKRNIVDVQDAESHTEMPVGPQAVPHSSARLKVRSSKKLFYIYIYFQKGPHFS